MRSTALLACGEGGGRKRADAARLGVEVKDEARFYEWLDAQLASAPAAAPGSEAAPRPLRSPAAAADGAPAGAAAQQAPATAGGARRRPAARRAASAVTATAAAWGSVGREPSTG
jgi:hypothetical protein